MHFIIYIDEAEFSQMQEKVCRTPRVHKTNSSIMSGRNKQSHPIPSPLRSSTENFRKTTSPSSCNSDASNGLPKLSNLVSLP